MEIQAFALLCALALVTFVSSATRMREIAWFVAGGVAGIALLAPSLLWLPWNPLLSSDPAQVSLLLGMLAFARIGNFVRQYLVLLVAGLLAVVWLQALVSLGYPSLLALLMVIAASCVAVLGSLYRPGFRTAFLLDEALLIVMLYALALAIVPAAMRGWDAAVGLRSSVDVESSAVASGAGVLVLAAGFAVLGAVFAAWRRFRITRKKTD